MSFNENTRVKIPAILHLCRLGYDYLPLSKAVRDENTNIFTDNFEESILRINPGIEQSDVKKTFENISLALDNEDLGRAFSDMLNATSGIRLIDYENFGNNSFHVVTELTYKNGEDEFRPDITLLDQRNAAGIHRSEEAQQSGRHSCGKRSHQFPLQE